MQTDHILSQTAMELRRLAACLELVLTVRCIHTKSPLGFLVAGVDLHGTDFAHGVHNWRTENPEV